MSGRRRPVSRVHTTGFVCRVLSRLAQPSGLLTRPYVPYRIGRSRLTKFRGTPGDATVNLVTFRRRVVASRKSTDKGNGIRRVRTVPRLSGARLTPKSYYYYYYTPCPTRDIIFARDVILYIYRRMIFLVGFFFFIIGLAAALLPYKLFLRRRLVLDRLPPARARIYFATPRADFPLLSPKITLYGGKYRTERLFPAHYRYYYYYYTFVTIFHRQPPPPTRPAVRRQTHYTPRTVLEKRNRIRSSRPTTTERYRSVRYFGGCSYSGAYLAAPGVFDIFRSRNSGN